MNWNIFKNKIGNNRKVDHGRGFTLVELLTVAAIVVIVSVYIMINYRRGNWQLTLELEANRFAENVRKMQEWSLGSHQVTGLGKWYGYGIYVNENEGSYILFVDGNNNGIYDGEPTDKIETSVVLNRKVGVKSWKPANSTNLNLASSSNINPTNIAFIPPDPVTKINNDLNFGTVMVQFYMKDSDDYDKYFLVIINRAGLVYVSRP